MAPAIPRQNMRPYRRANKLFMVQNLMENVRWYLHNAKLRSASRLDRLRIIAREYVADVSSIWHYGAPFPTFIKLIASLMLCLYALMPLIYPVFVCVITYFTFESLYLSWWLDDPGRFAPGSIMRRALRASFRPCTLLDMLKVRDVMTRGVLLAHSLATSVDYLFVMQGLLDET